ncbi:phosphatidylinositol transfer protein beta isoform-like isoform X3 [Artemia franciscana]|uniref:phosphatidylinositol transfer protein beta isoform-like isoform X3 n=1 Tax=Artemia franciscana TaxID=6661 RepID=UPI0032DB1771
MLIKEFRVVLPLTVEEYQVGQLYAVAQTSRENTGGGEGVEVRKNEPFNNIPLLDGKYSKGQYTYKVYHLASKVPAFIRMLAPKGSLEIHEEAWNAYPYCKTVLTVHLLTSDLLKQREVIKIDIANDPIASGDYKAHEDPSKFKSEKTGRGPLVGCWEENANPVMTCYKLVTCEFKWFGLQNRVESFIMTQEKRLFTTFHRQVFCLLDQWHGMTMEDIRVLENQVQEELDRQRREGQVRGITAASD